MKKLLVAIAIIAGLVIMAGKAIDTATANNNAVMNSIEGGR